MERPCREFGLELLEPVGVAGLWAECCNIARPSRRTGPPLVICDGEGDSPEQSVEVFEVVTEELMSSRAGHEGIELQRCWAIY